MRLLALDQASRTSGYAIFIDDKLETYGKFTLDNPDLGIRLNQMKTKINDLIDKYEIDYVAYEDIQLQNNVVNNVTTFKALAEVFGIVSELLVSKHISHECVLASSWKSTLKIRGKTRPEQKKNAQEFVNTTYNIKATQDECDAICIGTHIIKKLLVEQNKDFNWE